MKNTIKEGIMGGWRAIIASAAVATVLAGCGNASESKNSQTSATGSAGQSTTNSSTAGAGSPGMNAIESRIAAALNTPSGSAGSSAVVDAVVNCPDNVQPAQGQSFTCDVTGKTPANTAQPGAPMTGTATGTFTDTTGQAFSLTYTLEGGGYSSDGNLTSVP